MLNAATGVELSVRPVQVIEKPQRLGGSLGEKCFFILKWVGPPNIDIPQIHRRAPTDHPFGEDLPDAPRALDSDGVKPCRDKELVDFWGFAQQIAIVRGEALWAVKEQLHACLF